MNRDFNVLGDFAVRLVIFVGGSVISGKPNGCIALRVRGGWVCNTL